MIKFFRQIRYDLMKTGKTGKPALPAGRYFKYAIGEIILVVIGILIALQINNWNENRINANKETAILANIHKEFKQNRKQLDSVVFGHRRSHTNSAKIIKLFPIKSKPKPAVLDSLSFQLFWSFGGVTLILRKQVLMHLRAPHLLISLKMKPYAIY